jgi:hypothetical protein
MGFNSPVCWPSATVVKVLVIVLVAVDIANVDESIELLGRKFENRKGKTSA